MNTVFVQVLCALDRSDAESCFFTISLSLCLVLWWQIMLHETLIAEHDYIV